jgi:hypothetical protein
MVLLQIYFFPFGKDHTERDYLEDLALGGRIILKLIFKKCEGGEWTGLIWLRVWTGGGRL